MISPFKFWVQNVVPSEVDYDSLSYYEQLCKVVAKLQEVITQCNQTEEKVTELQQLYATLKSWVESYFENLDLQEQINNKLDEMVLDGTFTKLLQDLGFFSQNDIEPHRLFRYVTPTHLYESDLTERHNSNDWGQGMCKVGNHTMITLYNSSKYSDYVDYVIVDENNTIIRTGTFLGGHANSIYYDNGKLYVCPTAHNSNGTTSVWRSILIYDYATMSLIKEVPIDVANPYALTKDAKTNKWYMLGVGSGGINRVYSYDIETNVATELFTLYKGAWGFNSQSQSIAVINNNVYWLTATPNNMNVYDLKGNLLKIYSFKEWSEYFLIGECEDIYIDEDFNLTLYSVCFDTYPRYRFNQVWTYNLITGKNVLRGSRYDSGVNAVHVKKSNFTTYGKVYNPIGTTASPFEYIGEADITFANPNYVFSQIYIDDSENYDEIAYCANNNYTIESQNHKATINALICSRCEKVRVDNMIVDNELAIENSIHLYNCGKFLINDSTVINNSQTAETKCCIDNINGEIALKGNMTFSGFTKYAINNNSPYKIHCPIGINYNVRNTSKSSGGQTFRMTGLWDTTNNPTVPETIMSNILNGMYSDIILQLYSKSLNTRTSVRIPLTSSLLSNISSSEGATINVGFAYSSDNNFYSGVVSFKLTSNGTFTILKSSTSYILSNDTTGTLTNDECITCIDYV